MISCRFEPQGRYVFAGAEDNTVQRWALADGVKTPLVGHESWVKAIAFSKDGETTITGGSEGRLIWWPTAAEKPAEIRRIDARQRLDSLQWRPPRRRTARLRRQRPFGPPLERRRRQPGPRVAGKAIATFTASSFIPAASSSSPATLSAW